MTWLESLKGSSGSPIKNQQDFLPGKYFSKGPVPAAWAGVKYANSPKGFRQIGGFFPDDR